MESENMEHMDKTEHEGRLRQKNDGLRADEKDGTRVEERLEADACIESTSEEDARTAEEEKNIIWPARGDGYFSCSCWWQAFTEYSPFAAGRSVLQCQTGNFVFFGHCHRNLSMEAGRLISRTAKALICWVRWSRNHTKARKADAHHKMGYAFSSHRK